MDSTFTGDGSHAIEKELDSYFNRYISASKDISMSYERLWVNLHKLIKSGGKRLRPKITLLAYEIFGGKHPDSVVSIAAAHELLHFSLLIHDDIIDRDYMRYGVPNIAGRYQAFYQKHVTNDTDLVHYSHGAALLAGDLMLAGAHELIAQSPVSAEKKQIAQNLLAQSIFDVAGGELLDTEASFIPYTKGDAEKIALYKTSHYSFVIPLLTGAKLAVITAEQEAHLKDYAEALGIAYQLVDDLLGVFGNEETTGKSVLGDIREGKQTFLIEKAMERMPTEDKILFNLAFGNPFATSELIHQAKELLVSSGGKEITEKEIKKYKAKALLAASELRLPKAAEDKLVHLVKITTDRDY